MISVPLVTFVVMAVGTVSIVVIIMCFVGSADER